MRVPSAVDWKEDVVAVLIGSFWHGVWLARHDEIAMGVASTTCSDARNLTRADASKSWWTALGHAAFC